MLDRSASDGSRDNAKRGDRLPYHPVRANIICWRTVPGGAKPLRVIELMIVVAIVGILAAIALPAYQDYVIRSKMAEAIAAVAASKTSVTEYVLVRNAAPADASDAGCSTISSQYVASLSVVDLAITATTTNTGTPDCDLVLTPTLFPTGFGWSGSTNCDAKYVPANFRG